MHREEGNKRENRDICEQKSGIYALCHKISISSPWDSLSGWVTAHCLKLVWACSWGLRRCLCH